MRPRHDARARPETRQRPDLRRRRIITKVQWTQQRTQPECPSTLAQSLWIGQVHAFEERHEPRSPRDAVATALASQIDCNTFIGSATKGAGASALDDDCRAPFPVVGASMASSPPDAFPTSPVAL